MVYYIYIKKLPIIHCDLNAENISLTSEMKAKISDFGVSRVFVPDLAKYYMKMSKIPGNQLYMPHEI